jgi:hypothetical protein
MATVDKVGWWQRFIYYFLRAIRLVSAADDAYEREMELKKKEDKKDE